MRALSVCLLVAAACDQPAAPPRRAPDRPDARLRELADEACACPDLACMDRRQRVLQRMLEASHDGAADHAAIRARVGRCTDTLALRVEADIAALADELCACPDRACYEALGPRVDRVFSRDNVADVGPVMLGRIGAAAERFNRCDERFGAPAP